MDFKVSTSTQFTTTIDNTQKDEPQTPAPSGNSLEARDAFTSLIDHENPPSYNGTGIGMKTNFWSFNCNICRV